MANLHILIGCIGAGKTSFGRSNLDLKDNIYLSLDDLRGVIGESEEDQTKNYIVYKTIVNMTEYFLKFNRSVVIDATNRSKRARRDFINLGQKYGAKIHGYFFNTSLETCLQRNINRSRIVNEIFVRKYHSELMPPTHEEGFNVIEIFNTV